MTSSERRFGNVQKYNDEYATCERTYAELRMYTGATDPRVVSQELQLEPTKVRHKGVPWITPSGRPKPAKLNAWFLSSEEFVASRDLRRHLDWLLTRLQPRAAQLRTLLDMEGVRASIWCVWWSAHGHGGPTLDAGHMTEMGKLGLQCCFDLYFADDYDDWIRSVGPTPTTR